MEIKLNMPLTDKDFENLKVGDTILLSGEIYTGRDAAHKRLFELVQKGEDLPFDIKNAIIYYVGPTPARPGKAFGSAGPTTSYRMDAYAPTLIDLGLKGMIGKGSRNKEVIDAIIRNKGVYLGAIGGAGALIGKSVVNSEIIAYEDLGTEAIRRLTVKDLPVIVIIDSKGNNLYEQGQQEYLNSL